MSEIRSDKLHNASGDNDSGIDLSTNDQVSIKTANTTALTVDASQNVGIGTSSPSSFNSNANNLVVGSGSGGEGMTIYSGTTSNGALFFADGTSGASLTMGGVSYNHNDNSLNLRVNNDPKVYVISDGNVLVGTTTYGQPNANAVALGATEGVIRLHHINGTSNGTSYAIFTYNGLGIGSITQNTTSSVAFNTTSDHRLKENVTADWDATTRLKQLNPVRFNFIADADTTVDGFLAHEVQSVVPEAITGTHNEVDADGNPVYQGIDQSKLVPLLVKTIQELEARITALESE